MFIFLAPRCMIAVNAGPLRASPMPSPTPDHSARVSGPPLLLCVLVVVVVLLLLLLSRCCRPLFFFVSVPFVTFLCFLHVAPLFPAASTVDAAADQADSSSNGVDDDEDHTNKQTTQRTTMHTIKLSAH